MDHVEIDRDLEAAPPLETIDVGTCGNNLLTIQNTMISTTLLSIGDENDCKIHRAT